MDKEKLLDILLPLNKRLRFVVVGSAGMLLRDIPTIVRDIDIVSNSIPSGFLYVGSILYGNDTVVHYGKDIKGIIVDVSFTPKQYYMLKEHANKIEGVYVAHSTHILLAKVAKLALQISSPKTSGLWLTAPKNVMDILSIYYYEGFNLKLAKQYINELGLKDVINVIRFGEIATEVQIGLALASYPLVSKTIEDPVKVWAEFKSKLFYIIDEMLNGGDTDEKNSNKSSGGSEEE